MRPACIGSAILAAVLAWTATPARCLAALAASPRGGAAPASARPAEASPASSTAAPAAEGQGSGGAPAGGGAGAATPALTALWFAPGVAPGGAAAPGKGGAAVREARLLAAAAADELDALAAAARGEAPRGGVGGQPAFWSAAGALQRALADLDGALAAGDPAYFSILDEAQRSLVALQVAFRRAGTSREGRSAPEAGAASSPASDETTRRMTALAATVGRLGGAYGRGAVPASRPGGGLSAAQARHLQAMAWAARTWRAALPALAAAARQQGDAALQSELAKLDALLLQVASAQSLTLAAYLAAASVSNQALALWSANAAYLDPGEQQASQQADAAASDLTTAADTGFVFSADLSGGTAWTYAEGPPESGSGAAAGDSGDGGGGPGDRGGVPGDAGGPSGAAGGDEVTGLPGEPSAGVASTAGAGADAGPGAPGAGMAAASDAASSSSASGWVVIHGGTDASWQPDSLPPAAVSPRLAMQLGDVQDEELSSAGEPATDSGNDANDAGDAWDGASEPLDWEELCRPWQPAASSRGVCPVPALPELPAGTPGDR